MAKPLLRQGWAVFPLSGRLVQDLFFLSCLSPLLLCGGMYAHAETALVSFLLLVEYLLLHLTWKERRAGEGARLGQWTAFFSVVVGPGGHLLFVVPTSRVDVSS